MQRGSGESPGHTNTPRRDPGLLRSACRPPRGGNESRRTPRSVDNVASTRDISPARGRPTRSTIRPLDRRKMPGRTPDPMTSGAAPRLLVIGAHPDDAEYKAGGLAAIYRRLGHDVAFLSLTDGAAGHRLEAGPSLVARRRAEATAAASPTGIRAEV